jgi:hypothetical protein
MTKIENSNTKYNLNNSDNYNNYLTCNLKEIIDNYIYILLNYILLFNKKINNKVDNNNILFFIFKKGISTINYIFLFILYYTKNLELAFYHLQNSYIFYIEFIEQINFNSSNSIKISVNDAILFVYKKNIYNVNNSINNTTEQEKKIFLQIEEIIKIYNGIIDIFILHSQSQQNTFNLIELKNIIEDFQVIIYPKIKSKNIINLNFINLHIINSIQHFINLLHIINIPFIKKKELLFSFINEINSRKNIHFNSLTNNIQLFNFNDIDEDYDLSQIIPTMFSH